MKPIYLSRTIIGLFVGVIVTIAKKYGYHLDYDFISESLQQLIGDGLQLGAAVTILIGRIKASKQLSIK